MKLYITGPGRHGKDTVAEILSEALDLTFSSSSLYVAREGIVAPFLPKDYDSLEEMFEDRSNFRMEWRAAIENYNEKDPTRLSREIFERNDIYVGIRSRRELLASLEAEIASFAVWVDASRRVNKGDPSLDVKPKDCRVKIYNNGSLQDLREKVLSFAADLLLGEVRRVY